MRAWSSRRGRAVVVVLTLVALAGCAGGPPPPDWSVNAAGHVERFSQAWLKGDERVQAREFELARREVVRTGRVDLVARVELNRCAVHVASLDFAPCSGFDALAQDAGPAERAYARYLAGQAGAADVPLLPAPHRTLVVGGTAIDGIDDPLSQLVAAGVLLRQGRASPAVVRQAVDAASRQGWRRPLLAWLGVQLKLAQAHGDGGEVERLRRRMELVAPRPVQPPSSSQSRQ